MARDTPHWAHSPAPCPSPSRTVHNQQANARPRQRHPRPQQPPVQPTPSRRTRARPVKNLPPRHHRNTTCALNRTPSSPPQPQNPRPPVKSLSPRRPTTPPAPGTASRPAARPAPAPLKNLPPRRHPCASLARDCAPSNRGTYACLAEKPALSASPHCLPRSQRHPVQPTQVRRSHAHPSIIGPTASPKCRRVALRQITGARPLLTAAWHALLPRAPPRDSVDAVLPVTARPARTGPKRIKNEPQRGI